MATIHAESSDLLTAVVDAQGGLDLYNKIESISVNISVTGVLFALKGYPGHTTIHAQAFANPPKLIYEARDFGIKGLDPTHRLIWTNDKVWIEAADGTIVKSRENARDAFQGHELTTPWDELHLLYFRGYALWNYLFTPFVWTWPGFQTREIDPLLEPGAGSEWRGLEVTYPDGFAAHDKVQPFYFDGDNKLRRNDFASPITGASGTISHYSFDHQKVDGILFPFLRRVINVPDAYVNGGPTLVLLDVIDYKVNYHA